MTANVIDVMNTDVLAREVLEDQLANYATKELEEHFAAQWENENTKACVRTWEEREDGTFAKTYHDRKKQFQALARKTGKDKSPTVSMSPDLAKEELERYQRMPWSTIVNNEDYRRRWHELEGILGRPLTDFAKVKKSAEQPDYEKKIEEFLKMPHADRMRAVDAEKDRTLLGYIQTDDPERDVRERAQTRLFNLATEG